MRNFKITFIIINLAILLPSVVLAWSGLNVKDNDPHIFTRYNIKSNQTDTTTHNDRWISVDKGYHLIGSIISTTGITNLNIRFAKIENDKSLFIGAGFTLSLGLGKEFWDGRQENNYFSWKDLTADILGILIGSLLMQVD